MSSSSRDRMNDSYKNWTHFQCKNKLWKEGIREYFASQKFTRFFFSIRSTYVHISSIWLSVVTAIEYYAVYDEFFSLFLCILWHAVRPLAALTTANRATNKTIHKNTFRSRSYTHLYIYNSTYRVHTRNRCKQKTHGFGFTLYTLRLHISIYCEFIMFSCFGVFSIQFDDNIWTIWHWSKTHFYLNSVVCVFATCIHWPIWRPARWTSLMRKINKMLFMTFCRLPVSQSVYKMCTFFFVIVQIQFRRSIFHLR